MATAIWTGLDANLIRYDLSYDASRPDPYGDTVNITFYLRAYPRDSTVTFGYQIYWSAMWCAGTDWAEMEVKANSPNKGFDITKSVTATVSASGTSVGGVRLIMTSPNNSGTSGKYDTGTDISISVPAKASHTAPSAPTTITVPSSQYYSTGFTVSWSGASAGSRPISNYDLQVRAYNGSTWSSYVLVSNPTGTSQSIGAPNTLSYGGVTTAAYGTAMKLQFRVRASDGIALTSGWKESGTLSVTKNGRLMYKDSSGTWRECTRLKVKDTGGTVRNCTKLKVKDTSGTVRTIDFIMS